MKDSLAQEWKDSPSQQEEEKENWERNREGTSKENEEASMELAVLPGSESVWKAREAASPLIAKREKTKRPS